PYQIQVKSDVAGTGYWIGTKDGVTDTDQNSHNPVPDTFTYVTDADHAGTYTRKMEIRDDAGNLLCTTKTVTVVVNPLSCPMAVSAPTVEIPGSETFTISGTAA